MARFFRRMAFATRLLWTEEIMSGVGRGW